MTATRIDSVLQNQKRLFLANALAGFAGVVFAAAASMSSLAYVLLA